MLAKRFELTVVVLVASLSKSGDILASLAAPYLRTSALSGWLSPGSSTF